MEWEILSLFSVFKSKISACNQNSCTCRLCNEYIDVGFMWYCSSSHIDFINNFQCLGFVLSDSICFYIKVFLNPGSTHWTLVCLDPVTTSARLF